MCVGVYVSTIKLKLLARNDLKLETVVFLDTVSKPIDFGFKRSRVTDTGSASLCIFGLSPTRDEEPLPLLIFIHADDVSTAQ